MSLPIEDPAGDREPLTRAERPDDEPTVAPVGDAVAAATSGGRALTDGAVGGGATDGLDEEPASDGPPIGPLPEQVRARVVGLAAEALGALRAEEVPGVLRNAARFTPSKRARLAATALAGALETDPTFRQRVAERAKAALPAIAEALAASTVPAAAAPVDVAAMAYLARPAGWRDRLAEAIASIERDLAAAAASDQVRAERQRADEMRAARAAAKAGTEKLRAELERLRRENDDLRHRLGQTRERARRAEASLEDIERQAAADVAAEQARAASSEAELRRLRSRLADAEAAVDAARRAAREGRSADDVRLWLLLDTLVNAAHGLRRELALPPPASRPADAIGGEGEAAPFAGVAVRGLETDDPAVLDQLLALPGVHLVVDGYNVTKTGYGGLALEAQRSRLVAGLGALAARTNTEVTCVFDGAQVDARVTTAARGVRVRFSDPGETADELIRRLVRAEPTGRPVVVVSSDREVADGVRQAGARAVSAAALLRRLERG